jgi:hypothetical protein
MKVVRYADRPAFMARRCEELTKLTLPEYMNKPNVWMLHRV